MEIRPVGTVLRVISVTEEDAPVETPSGTVLARRGDLVAGCDAGHTHVIPRKFADEFYEEV